MYIEKVLDLWVQLMKNGGKNKSVAFIILVSVWYIYIYGPFYRIGANCCPKNTFKKHLSIKILDVIKIILLSIETHNNI